MPRPAEDDVEDLARQILRSAQPSPAVRVRNAFDVNTRLLTWATKRPHFKTGLFRFVDVFPACTSPHDVLDHLDEYIVTDDTPGIVRAGLGTAHALPFGARAARRVARRHPSHGAPVHRGHEPGRGRGTRRRVVGRRLREHGRLARREDAHPRRCRRVRRAGPDDARCAGGAPLRRGAARPRSSGTRGAPCPASTCRSRPSALAPLLAPATADEGVAEALERLAPILDAARAANATIHLDTEHDELKDATYQSSARSARATRRGRSWVAWSRRTASTPSTTSAISSSGPRTRSSSRSRSAGQGRLLGHRDDPGPRARVEVAGMAEQGRDRRVVRGLRIDARRQRG